MVTYDVYEIEWVPSGGIPEGHMSYSDVYEKCLKYGKWNLVASYEDYDEAQKQWENRWFDHSRILTDYEENWCAMYVMAFECEDHDDPCESYEIDYSVCCFEGE